MRIISPYKDYYDYVQYVYGEDKSSNVYTRSVIDVSMYQKSVFDKNKAILPIPDGWTGPWNWGGNNPIYKSIVVVGKVFYFVQTENGEWAFADMFSGKFHRRAKVDQGEYVDSAWKLCKQLGAPVFVCATYPRIMEVNEFVPNLGIHKIAHYYPAEQIYQDIEYFLTNTMHENPDNSPPTKMVDSEKIVSHGFDIRQSFRHRK